MATQSWASFEDKVRAAATYIWNGKCEPRNIGGVNVDGVIDLGDDVQIFIEMTEQRDLNKVREDVVKLQVARAAYLAEHQSFPRCFCVVNGSITNGMKDAGAPHNIKVLSFEQFSAIFFDFEKYRYAREAAAFGSAINPLTGEKDNRAYVPVKYIIDGTAGEIEIAELAKLVRSGKRVVLLGEYGSGKSRCYKELFTALAADATKENLYPLALDLRDFWGLRRSQELIARHIGDLGLDTQLQNAATRASIADRVIFLLDGFDELGSQAWSNDSEKLRAIRSKSLEGVRDLISKGRKGVLVSGREHYFNNNAEMLSALGLTEENSIIVRCKEEFTREEMQEFFRRISLDVELPTWLPRRPLICQTIADMSEDDLDQMFGVGQDELGFFDHFIKVLCERDANIRATFDAKTIETVLIDLARLTRVRPANVGPITLSDVQSAFERVVGQLPVEDASLMLQRLPALGRVKAETNERQFIDTYILDGLRAKDAGRLLTAPSNVWSSVIATAFSNPLDELGQRLLARDISDRRKAALEMAQRCAASANRTLAGDIVAGFMHLGERSISFERLELKEPTFIKLDLAKTEAVNLTISDAVFGTLVLPATPPRNTRVLNSLAEKVVGVTSPTGLPDWVVGLEADKYDSTESISRIRKIGLAPAQEILVTVVRKTFFQKGAGRKEEALLRGLGQLAPKATASEIVNLLLRHDILKVHKGNEGNIYAPNRKHAGRMKKMLYELTTSQDEVWLAVSSM